MSRKFLTYGAGLIALYLLVVNVTNSGNLITSAAGGASTVIASFQGRPTPAAAKTGRT